MDLYLLYKFFDLKKLMTSGTPLERELRVRVRVRVIVRILHKADLYQLLVSTTDLELGVLFRRLE